MSRHPDDCLTIRHFELATLDCQVRILFRVWIFSRARVSSFRSLASPVCNRESQDSARTCLHRTQRLEVSRACSVNTELSAQKTRATPTALYSSCHTCIKSNRKIQVLATCLSIGTTHSSALFLCSEMWMSTCCVHICLLSNGQPNSRVPSLEMMIKYAHHPNDDPPLPASFPASQLGKDPLL
ncbi:hypothetical protein FA15DRAFT_176200 [Coprinopsis marcescibilis]|uniref:Uncharacterized protein n=1 Tax=Coprinopsis marcescibilis TaxID=230819 RepID=A0A5C3KHP4_COPMA|nr:hypothetical protein FA15DRAFT_176200 [Coprinopsis marcescibilis]